MSALTFTCLPVCTIREATPEELERGYRRGTERVACPKYLVVNFYEPDEIIATFGIPDGGDTQEEAVFWAVQHAAKSGSVFKRPDGWENVQGVRPT